HLVAMETGTGGFHNMDKVIVGAFASLHQGMTYRLTVLAAEVNSDPDKLITDMFYFPNFKCLSVRYIGRRFVVLFEEGCKSYIQEQQDDQDNKGDHQKVNGPYLIAGGIYPEHNFLINEFHIEAHDDQGACPCQYF